MLTTIHRSASIIATGQGFGSVAYKYHISGNCSLVIDIECHIVHGLGSLSILPEGVIMVTTKNFRMRDKFTFWKRQIIVAWNIDCQQIYNI